ncbi:MAG: RNA polymerase sigma factor [Cyclobacteriaceae bacterium]|jgi:RNA polymerase sigma-70 factor (ECF subfamily)|nr:RNA polymerase sigma factor [Cyclobacteriaceae bacterium]
MKEALDQAFLNEVNQNLGIAHKVARLYFNDADERDDVMQEMMYQLWRSYPRFTGRSKFSTWMYSVCLNTALTYVRKSSRRKSDRLSEKHLQIAEPVTDNQQEKFSRLYKAIEKLSALNRAIIMLYLDDLSYEEIATITGLTRTNVGVRLVRIKSELEKEMKQMEVN